MSQRIEIENHLHNNGYKLKGKHIIKNSSKGRPEICGLVNATNLYFFSENPYPYKSQVNLFRDILGDDYKPEQYQAPEVKALERENDFTLEQYQENSMFKNRLSTFLKEYDTDASEKLYNIKGVKSGYLKGATYFPYINHKGVFRTAKAVMYNQDTGKRDKDIQGNWFHAYRDILRELDMSFASKSAKCFFGEHLVPENDNPIVILESEKTALIMSALFDGITFIATGGLHFLRGLDTSFMADRDIYLFPDNGAKEWFKIAKERDWYVSELLEKDFVKTGSDIADFLEVETDEEEALTEALRQELEAIVSGDLIRVRELTLNFGYKQKKSMRFCSNNMSEKGFVTYRDDSTRCGGEYFRGNHFKIYDNKFGVLTSNIDLNRWEVEDGKKVQPTEEDFIDRLKETFLVAKRLNPEFDLAEMFHLILPHVVEFSNYTFSSEYILMVLIPAWDTIDSDASEYIRPRDWQSKMSTDATVKDIYEFMGLLADDRVLKRFVSSLERFLTKVDNNRYIQPSSIGIDKKRGNTLVWNLVNRYNDEFIQCATEKTFDNLMQIADYLEDVLELDQNSVTVYDIYRVANICSNFKLPSTRIIHDNVLVSERAIKKFKGFEIDDKAEQSKEEIVTSVRYLLNNRDKVSFDRVKMSQKEDSKSVIEASCSVSIEDMTKYYDAPVEIEAVVYEDECVASVLDLTNSIFNQVDEVEAIQRGEQFHYEWLEFHNKDSREIDFMLERDVFQQEMSSISVDNALSYLNSIQYECRLSA